MPEIDYLSGHVAVGRVAAAAPPLSGRIGTVQGTAVSRGSSEPSSGTGPAFQACSAGTPPRPTWSLRSYLELGALPGAVLCARLHSRHVLSEWGLAPLSESAELIVSELVTNAVQATADREVPLPVRLWLSSDHHRVRIAVWDAVPSPPQPQPALTDGVPNWSDDGGRGLFLVANLSEEWGCCATPGVGRQGRLGGGRTMNGHFH